MFTVVLADDEPMILKGLERLIDWKKLGITIVGTACDGAEAFKLIKKFKPDMIVSDINMPNLTGIELLKRIKADEQSTRVIFISGYQEFEYARDALKYGAVDYLLKPINEKQLTIAIEKIINEKIENTASEQHLTLQLNLDNEDEGKAVEEAYLSANSHVIDGGGHYGVICCGIDEDEIFEKDDCEIVIFTSLNIIEQLVSDIEGHWVINKNNRIYVLVYHHVYSEVESLISTLPSKIIDTIWTEINQQLSVSTGQVVSDINHIRDAYQMANEGMDSKYFYGKSNVIPYRETHRSKYTLEDHYVAQVGILNSIMSYDKSKICKAVTYYMDIVKDVSIWDKKSAINYCLATLVFVTRHIEDSTIQLENMDIKVVRARLVQTSYYSEMIEIMVELYEHLLEEISVYVNTKENTEIIKVKKYIQMHYSEPIKLETLADLVYMNPNYFSGYFKKHVGMKYKEYLTMIRINEAEKIILSTDKKVYEIAEAVGFGDYRHFSVVFKKIKGKSPSEYKNMILKI